MPINIAILRHDRTYNRPTAYRSCLSNRFAYWVRWGHWSMFIEFRSTEWGFYLYR